MTQIHRMVVEAAVAVLVTAIASAQDPAPSIQWERVFETPRHGQFTALVATDDGGYAAVGGLDQAEGGSLARLVKIDCRGEPLWERFYGRPGTRYQFSDVQQTADGGFIMVGLTGPQRGNENAYIVRADRNGELLWEKIVDTGGGNRNDARSVAEVSSGGFIIVGRDELIPLTGHVLRLDADGELLWERVTEGAERWEGAAGRDVIETSDGGFAIAEGGTFTLRRTDAAGETLWAVALPDAASNSGAVVETGDGGFVVTGNRRVNTLFLAKADADGELLWWHDVGPGWAHEIVGTEDGGFAIPGVAAETPGRDGVRLPWLIRTNAEGNVLWQLIHDGVFPSRGFLRGLQPTPEGGWLAVGDVWTEIGDRTEIEPYLLKLGSGNEGTLRVSFTAIPEEPQDGEEVLFDASSSNSLAGEIASYLWQFGDGETATTPLAHHTYERPGRYLVSLSVATADGLCSSANRLLVVRCPAEKTAPWSTVDIGEPAYPSSARFEGEGHEACLVVCAGGDGFSPSDQGQVVHQRVSGDVVLTARLAELTTSTDVRVGVSLRESLDPEARHVAMIIEASGTRPRFRFLRREQPGASRRSSLGDALESARGWVRVAREGDDFVGLSSLDGTSWKEVSRVTLQLPDELFAGVTAAGRDATPDGSFEALSARLCNLHLRIGETVFRRGDSNADERRDLSDGVLTLQFLFSRFDARETLRCLDAADVDDNGRLAISDAIHLFNYLFLGGAPPAAPFLDCDIDPTEDELDCDRFVPCETGG